MRFLLFIVVTLVSLQSVYAQNFNEHRPTASVSVAGNAQLIKLATQYADLHLIDVGVEPAQQDAQWQIDLSVERFQEDTSIVALSMVASQLAPTDSKATSKSIDGEIEQGEWISRYLENESRRHARYIELHEVTLGSVDDLETMVGELIHRFSESAIKPIREHLKVSKDH